MRTIITGSAGFIGFHLTKYLLQKGYEVIGIDNFNSYYDTSLKEGRFLSNPTISICFRLFSVNNRGKK